MSFSIVKKWAAHSLLTTTLIALVACGGGGGGSSGVKTSAAANSSVNNTGNFVVTFSKTELNQSIPIVGDTLKLDATTSGDPGVETVYVGAIIDGDAISTADMVIGGSSGTLFINTKRDLWSGVYKGTITINICTTQSCSKHLAKSPYKIPYSFTVTNPFPRLEPISTKNINYFTVNSMSQNMVVSTQGDTPSDVIQMRMELPNSITNFSIDANVQQQLSISNLQRTGFTLTLPAKAEGTYEWNPTIKTVDNTGKEGLFDFKITQIVSPTGVDVNSFWLAKKNLAFSLPTGIGRTSYEFVPYYSPNSGCSSKLNLSIDYINGDKWLIADDWSNDGKLYIIAMSEGLLPGTYKANVTAKTCGGLSNTLEVSLVIESGFVADNNFDWELFFSARTAPFNEFRIKLFATPDSYPINWKVTSLDGLQLNEQGLTGTANASLPENYIKFKFTPEYIASLPNSKSYVSRIQIADPTGKLKTIINDVRITKMMPEITSISTQGVEAGKPFDLTIKGENFPDNISDLQLAISRKNTGTGLPIFLPLAIDFVQEVEDGAIFNFSAIDIPGDYELIVQTATDYDLGYEIPLVPRMQLKVIAPATQSKLNYKLVPMKPL
jgi:hypothetical protein